MSAGCQKIRFLSRAEASAWARQESARTGAGGQRPYFCEPCACWHLSRRTARDGRQMRRRGLA